MSNVALSRPTLVTGQIITGSKLGTAGTDFYIKVDRARFNVRNPDKETSGDGDAAPSFDLSYWMYVSFSLVGYMPAQSVATFPLASIFDSTKNPIVSSNLKFWFSTSQVLTFVKAVITTFDISWGRNDAAVGLGMVGKATDSHPTWGTS